MTAISKSIEVNKTYKYDVESIPDVTTDNWYIKSVSSTNTNFSFTIGEDKKSFSYTCSNVEGGTVLTGVEFDLTIGFDNKVGPSRTDKTVKTYWDFAVTKQRIPFVVSAYIYIGYMTNPSNITIEIKNNATAFSLKYYISDKAPDTDNLPDESLYQIMNEGTKTFSDLYPYHDNGFSPKYLYLLGGDNNKGTYDNTSGNIRFYSGDSTNDNSSYIVFYENFSEITSLAKPDYNATEPFAGSFSYLFQGCKLDNYPTLPKYVGDYTLRGLFKNCQIPNLMNLKFPLNTGTGCYYEMFANSTSINNNVSLDKIKFNIPIIYMGDGAFENMFYNCQWLTSIPDDFFNIKRIYCGRFFRCMFQDCKKLKTVPSKMFSELEIIYKNTFDSMFKGCTSLTNVPDLSNIKSIGESSYNNMFQGCTSLTTIPENLLPVTTLSSNCYEGMFQGCTSLTTIPENLLPATTLSSNCYNSMFYNCTQLTKAPILPATTLSSKCYSNMFYGCSNLNYIKALFTEFDTTKTSNWLNGVASTGTFVKSADLNIPYNSPDTVPSGWTVVTATD